MDSMPSPTSWVPRYLVSGAWFRVWKFVKGVIGGIIYRIMSIENCLYRIIGMNVRWLRWESRKNGAKYWQGRRNKVEKGSDRLRVLLLEVGWLRERTVERSNLAAHHGLKPLLFWLFFFLFVCFVSVLWLICYMWIGAALCFVVLLSRYLTTLQDTTASKHEGVRCPGDAQKNHKCSSVKK